MNSILSFLSAYDGPSLRFMEVCGTHTAAIAQSGIRALLPPGIQLISGPGCPVCVTVTDYIDKLIALSQTHTIVTFGDLLRVPGSQMSLNDARAQGGRVQMVYAPMDALSLAAQHPETAYVFAAVGFETTAPVYAMLLQRAVERDIRNLKLLISLKTMPPVIAWVCRHTKRIDGFLAPGHVSVITGCKPFEKLAADFQIPFAIAGFDAPQLLAGIYTLVKRQGRPGAVNLYKSAVTKEGNPAARSAVERFFIPCDAAWRGMGVILQSGLALRPEFSRFDAGSAGLTRDTAHNPACRCAQVLTGTVQPSQCPLFGRTCTPQTPQGACMVSMEGSCYHYFVSQGGNAV